MSVSKGLLEFRQLLYVMNEALKTNRDKFPYKQIITALEKTFPDWNMGVAVYADDPNTPHDYFTIRFDKGEFELVEHGKEEPKFTWKVPESYVKKVTDNPQDYIQHPEKLDWDFVKSRIGLDK